MSTPSTVCTTCSCTAGSRIFPPTEFWSRVPSGLAVGGAAAGVVVLGKQFSSRTVALASGVVCAILPRATWAGIEARPYALSMMAAVWLTVLLVYATRRDNALGVAVLRDRPGDVGSARRVSRCCCCSAYVVFICVFRRSRTVVATVRRCVGSGGLRRDAVCDRRPSAKRIRSAGSHRLGTARSKMWRFNSISNEARRSRFCRRWS